MASTRVSRPVERPEREDRRMHTLTESDEELIAAASALLMRAYDPTLHRVAAAARGSSGSIHLGLSLATPRVNVCAESSAVANAKIAGDERVETMVSVGLGAGDVPVVINPCGVCRELVPKFADDLRVLVDAGDRVAVASPAELLPMPWVRARSYD